MKATILYRIQGFTRRPLHVFLTFPQSLMKDLVSPEETESIRDTLTRT